jgi:hypothetical protein
MKRIFNLIKQSDELEKRMRKTNNVFFYDSWKNNRQSILNDAKELTNKLNFSWYDVIIEYYKINY